MVLGGYEFSQVVTSGDGWFRDGNGWSWGGNGWSGMVTVVRVGFQWHQILLIF